MLQIAARAPNHLGDGVMALPALHALAVLGSLTIYAPLRFHALYADLGVPLRTLGRMQADVAVLFAPSLRAAWEARRVKTVIGTPTDHRRIFLTRSVPVLPSRGATYAALAAAAGAKVVGEPSYSGRGEAAEVPEQHVALNPLAAGGRNREWTGFRALADELHEPVVFYGGPGEEGRILKLAGPHPAVVGLTLPDLAATLQRARVMVSNDTGPAHFARAVGCRTVVVHTSTTAARTGPAGALPVEGPSLACRPCYRNTCSEQLQCLDIPVARVRALL